MLSENQIKRLEKALSGLNEWETEVVLREAEDIAEALRVGHGVYGPWDPSADGRDHAKEAEQEDRDRRVYTQMGRIVGEMKGQKDSSRGGA